MDCTKNENLDFKNDSALSVTCKSIPKTVVLQITHTFIFTGAYTHAEREQYTLYRQGFCTLIPRHSSAFKVMPLTLVFQSNRTHHVCHIEICLYRIGEILAVE